MARFFRLGTDVDRFKGVAADGSAKLDRENPFGLSRILRQSASMIIIIVSRRNLVENNRAESAVNRRTLSLL
jgi:hypothetical protein